MSEEQAKPKQYMDAVCTGDVEFSTTDSGTEQVFINVALPTGEIETVILFLSEKALPYTQEKLHALGWSGKGAIGPQIKDKPCRIAISFETWEGKERKRVDLVKSGGGSGLKAKNPATESAAAVMLRKLEAAAASAGDFPPPLAAAAAPPKPRLF